MNARPHKRSQSNGLKPPAAHVRSNRPSLSSKRAGSYNHAAVSHPSASLRRQKSGVDVSKQCDTDDEAMAASFLQFCATCERQIVTPSFSILYCSESCRRRDSTTTTPLPHQSPPISPTTHAHAYCEHEPVDILPQRSPTVVRPLSTTFSELNLARTHSNASSTSDSHPYEPYNEYDYDDYDPDNLDPHVLDLPGYPTSTALAPRRPSTKRASTSNDVPSLVHSPASSYGTTASHYHHTATNRSTTTRSIDLVIPLTAPPSPTLLSQQDASLKSQASTLTTLRIAEANNTTEGRRPSLEKSFRRDSSQQGPAGAAMGSLRQLFNHDAIRCASRRRSRE